MKKISILTVALVIPVILSAQPASVRRILRSCDTGREVTRIHLPPVVFRLASWLVDDESDRRIVRNFRCLYVVTSEDREFSRKSDFPSRVVEKLRKGEFEEMLVAREKGEKVTILWRDRGPNRKEMIVAVDGDEDTVIYLRGRLDFEEIMKDESLDKIGLNRMTHVSI
jgi:hypothetical protein